MMASSRWKSLSSLDGSEKTFWERVRSPDPKFPFLLRTLAFLFPLIFAFIAIPFALFPLVSEAALGTHSWVTEWITAVSNFVLKLVPFAILLIFVAMYVLRGYVATKLRRQQRVESSGKS
jgi:hypothetical protein